jgi:hypothetical protein
MSFDMIRSEALPSGIGPQVSRALSCTSLGQSQSEPKNFVAVDFIAYYSRVSKAGEDMFGSI